MDLVGPLLYISRQSTGVQRHLNYDFLGIISSTYHVVVVVKTETTLNEKVKNRLEQLDDVEEGSIKQLLDLSQQEYCSQISQLNDQLTDAWKQDQRVKALKIVIQVG